jgi:hypothetical protein
MLNKVGECFSCHEFNHQESSAARFLDPVDCSNVRMIPRCEHARFACESRRSIGVIRECFRQ